MILLSIKFISNEHLILKNQLENNVKTDDKLNELFQSLKQINSKLWVIEDEIRQCEKDKIFGNKFVKLARDVYFTNDVRSEIKKEINILTNSGVIEEKSYEDYS